MSAWDIAARFLDRFGVAIFVMVWFMIRNERLMLRLITRVNKLIISQVVIAKTLDLDEEQDRLVRAATDDEDSGKTTLNVGAANVD